MADIIDVLFEFLHFFEIFPAMEKQWSKFKDEDLHMLKRIWSLFLVLFLMLFFLSIIVFIFLLIYRYFIK